MIERLTAELSKLAPIHGVSIGDLDSKETWRIDFQDDASASQKDAAIAHLASFDAGAPSSDDVKNELKRRLELGFRYDFQDDRGVHHIGTTAADMVGWRDVIDYANALIDSGDTTTLIDIVTDTGPTQVTAPEWQAVMLAAGNIRQNLWAKSFALQSMSPIPGDYANDSYWSQ